MGNPCLLVFTGDSSFQGFLGGAGFRPSTVGLLILFGESRTEMDGTGELNWFYSILDGRAVFIFPEGQLCQL